LDRVFNKKFLKEKRRKLRNNPTYAEKFLWYELRKSQLQGRKFRRQVSIGNYIVDFYCPAERLAIELDGKGHFEEEQMKYDEKRTQYLQSIGIRVLRFENQEILYNTESVLKQITLCFKNNK
jgi:very-short-patch-repair endonuclease